PGDVIRKFAGIPTEQIDDLRRFVLASPQNVNVEVQRAGLETPLVLELTLNESPVKWGISWRDDAVEPSSVILTRVVRGSPAEEAGLRPHDRILEVNGERFSSPREFHEQVSAAKGGLTLLTE